MSVTAAMGPGTPEASSTVSRKAATRNAGHDLWMPGVLLARGLVAGIGEVNRIYRDRIVCYISLPKQRQASVATREAGELAKAGGL